MDTYKVGKKGEETAIFFLKKKKIKIVEKNFYSKHGEIDIIGLEKKTLVFYEVKYRKSNFFGESVFSITDKKKKKLIKTALFFLMRNKMYEKYDKRFDAVLINDFKNDFKISFIKNIFLTDNNRNGFFY